MTSMIIYFVFSAFTSRPTSLLASKRVSVFSFMVFILSSSSSSSSSFSLFLTPFPDVGYLLIL
jgi:hypothetical protein